jgi:putative restriction endonuclease
MPMLHFYETGLASWLMGIRVPQAASHIKPWADYTTDAERLDVYNGLLLAPHLDALFDQGFITVADDGNVTVSSALDQPSRKLLGAADLASSHVLAVGHHVYLQWHRGRVFKKSHEHPEQQPTPFRSAELSAYEQAIQHSSRWWAAFP